MTLRLETFAPSSIIFQSQTQAEASGFAYTLNPETGLRQHFYIAAIWGCPDTELMETAQDTYVVDNRSHAVIMRTVGSQPHYYRRKQDGVERVNIPLELQSKPVLPDELCAELSRILQRIKRQNIHHAKVFWELTPTGFEITEHTAFHETTERQPHRASQRATKVYITGGNPYKTRLDPLHQADGIGVLRSEYTYMTFGIHPMTAIKNRQRDALHQKLVSAIKTFKSVVHGKPVLFRSLFLTSKELLQLEYAGSQEPSEPNPFLGWRGGLRLTHQPQLLEFELDVVRAALEQTGSTVGYTIPFVRHPQELDRILLAIKQQGLRQHTGYQTWWQLNTPENLLSFSRYPTAEIDGIIIHQHTIQALLQGIDPTNPEITDRYSHDPDAFMQLLDSSIKEIQRMQQLRPNRPLQVLLYLEQYEAELIAQAVRLRLDGVIVKPTALAITLESVAEYEHTQVLHI